ncbi:AAA family ATPase [Sorangium sp. So ce362]|uniref:AAA family ATPase n=1 Tax=Sorangium sp. So ce362 TaxID=3133303 RepID=UPI003F5E6B3B
MIDLSGYTLSERVYEGAESVLYRGRRDDDGTPVAVKVTRSDFPTARDLARLRRELAILRDAGEVPGVVKAYALEKCGRGLALVMEDLGPSSLQTVLRTRRLDVGTTLRIAIALSGTLDALHGLRIIHKDIKPHNILIDEATYSPRLVDFGIAARLSRETPRTAPPDALEGTLSYIAPEQTGRMNRIVDLRADLYSFGVTLYEMVTGVLPFAGLDPTALIHSHMARTPTPPDERAPEVPGALSRVIMKLLAKTPEERYQSARGLKSDLEECLRRWQATGRIEPFPLGQRDMPLDLRVPQLLYGREHEVKALLSAFNRARHGAAGLVLVSGYSGVGKSALVNEIHRPIARHGGYFAKGKFDPIHRGIPLAPIAQAFRELIRQILTESAGAVEAWKGKLLGAVGANGQLLVELIPELELLIGPQPEVPALGPSEARNRFDLLVQRFVQVFASPTRPLAIFLDDLQWADPASLRLVERLLTDVECKYLLLVGAYRDNEVDAAHPLLAVLGELREAGVEIAELELRALDLPTVTRIVADTLSAQPHDVAPLAALVFEKTEGNPFFLSQLLGALHDARALWFDASLEAWAWDVARVREAMVSDNVVDLMLDMLHRLPEATRRALELAACLGHAFELTTLATIHQRAPVATAADLWDALRGGLIVPLDSDYRFFDGGAGAEPSAVPCELNVSYRFLHDRVRQAAYSLVEPARREAVHLEIGRLLWARAGETPPDDHLLDVVRHLNLGARGMREEAERVAVARLNLRAGRAAKARTAYAAGADYFGAGLELLGDAGWGRHDALCFALSRENAECVYLSGAPERAEELFTALLPRARSSAEQAQIHNLRVVLYSTLGKYVDAVQLGREGLRLLGFTLPDSEAERQACVEAELSAVDKNLAGRRIEDLIDAPVMDDPERKALLQLLCDLTMPVFFARPELYQAIVLKQVNISLKHGSSDVSAFAYLVYGFMLATMQGRPADGHAFGRLALALNDKLRNASLAGKVNAAFCGYSYLSEPLRDAMPYYLRARQEALESGDFVYLGIAWYAMVNVKLGAGYQLEELREEVDRGFLVARRLKDATATAVLLVVRQAIAALQGRTRARDSLSDADFDEDQFLAGLNASEQGAAVFLHAMSKLQLRYLHGDHEGAAAMVDDAEAKSVGMFGMYHTTRLPFYAGLSLLALPAAAPDEAERRAQTVARHRERIAGLAASAPMNFLHQLLLLQAEEARIAGEQLEAMRLYDRSIELARENGFPHDEALANELCAKMHLRAGRAKVARAYMIDAYLGYQHWGATAKADALARDHAGLLPSSGDGVKVSSIPSSVSGAAAGRTILGRTTVGNLRDAALIVRAAQGIAGETELERVIERLVTLVLENAGAQRGALLLERDGRLFVEATFGVEPEALVLGPSEPLDARADVPHAVALFVARIREPLVVDDAGADARFSGDPCVVARGTRSVLCLPMLHQTRLSGILYLENNATCGAFNSSRVELLGLLSSQAAISIENALLLASTRAANDEVQRVNGRLEADVAQRTEELRRSNAELGAANERLQIELVQREEAERERTALQRQMLDTQRAMVAELSTPLIPITDRIMVMPLIGTMHAERAAQVLEVALDGAQRYQAKVVILDITGMKHIDTHIAGTLLGTARALRLLGTEAVLTGIRAEVAQAMVRLDIEMSSIVTMGTLQSGIAYALRRCGPSQSPGLGAQPPSAGRAAPGARAGEIASTAAALGHAGRTTAQRRS